MFRSFYLAGFECATGFNRHRQWIDQICATQHDRFLSEDYLRLKQVGIHTVREGMRWPIIDTRSGFDLSHVKHVVETARRHRMQVIYDLFHYGYPHDVDIFGDNFADRFSEYC